MKRFLIFINILCSICLLITIAGCYVNPTYYWPFAFMGFIFPFFWVLNVGIAIFWLLTKHKRFALLSLIPVLLTYSFMHSSFSLSSKDNQEQGVKVISYNVRNFDLYNWSKNKETRQKMLEMLEEEKPDILCLQEFYTDSNQFNNIQVIRKLLDMPYYHYEKTVVLTKKRWRSWGVITFSKYPIVNKGVIDFDNSVGNTCIYTDIRLKDTMVRVYNLHTQSIHLGYEDYKYIDSVQEKKEASSEGAKNILRKIKRAAVKRGKQVNEVVSEIDKNPYASIVCGDFNDPPVSYTYHKISHNLQDVHIKNGFGFGRTYSKIFPTLRIDYIFLDPIFNINSYKVIKKEYSDHYPIVSTFSLKP